MPDTNRNGCGLWTCVTVAVSVLFAVFVGIRASTDVQTLSATASPTVMPSNIVTVATVVPEDKDSYFAVEDNQITYAYIKTFGEQCSYFISGSVLDIEGKPFVDFVVNIKILDEHTPEEAMYAYAGDGAYPEDLRGNPSAWATVLPQSSANYEIWLTREIGGIELSRHVIVSSKTCDHNRAIVNFVQAKPLPPGIAITPATLLATVIPKETNAYFVVQDNVINYVYAKTLGLPCMRSEVVYLT